MGYTKKQLETAMMMLLTDTLPTIECEKVKKEGNMYCSRCDECMMEQYVKKAKQHLKLYKSLDLPDDGNALTYYAYQMVEERTAKAYELEEMTELEALKDGSDWLMENIALQKILFINAYGFKEFTERIRLDSGQKPYVLKEKLRNAKYYK